MAHDTAKRDVWPDWRPDVDVPRDYPPPQRLWLGGVSPTPDEYQPPPVPPDSAWQPQAARSRHPGGPPRDGIDLEPLRRCLADVEAAAQRLRALLARLGP